MEQNLRDIEQKENIRILCAWLQDVTVHVIFVRPEADYLKVLNKPFNLSGDLGQYNYEGKDLKGLLQAYLQTGDLLKIMQPMIYQSPQWTYLIDHLNRETADELFLAIVTGRVNYEVIDRRTRLSDFIYEKVPDAEIEIENCFGEHLYLYGYKATAYEAYGIMDISWLDHDFDSGEVDQESHTVESFDSFSKALHSPYAELFLEIQDLLYGALSEEEAYDAEDEEYEEEEAYDRW